MMYALKKDRYLPSPLSSADAARMSTLPFLFIFLISMLYSRYQSTDTPGVPQCLSPRPNWDHPTPPLPHASVYPPPPQPKEGGTHLVRMKGWGSPNSDG